LLELYVSGTDPDLAEGEVRSVREAAATLTRKGTPVQYRSSMFVSAEETCFVFLEAESTDAVRDVARLAQVSCSRISAVVSHPSADWDQSVAPAQVDASDGQLRRLGEVAGAAQAPRQHVNE